MGSLRELIEAGNVSRSGKRFVQNILRLQADVADAVSKGASSEYQLTLEGAGKRAIMRDLMADLDAEAEEIGAEVGKEQARYNDGYFKDLAKHDFMVRSAATKYAGMNAKELSEVVIHAGVGDPHVHDALQAELVKRGMPEADAFRKLRAERQLDSPWLATENGRALAEAAALCKPVVGGGIRIRVDGQDGKSSTAAVSYGDILDAFTAEEKDGDSEE